MCDGEGEGVIPLQMRSESVEQAEVMDDRLEQMDFH